MSLQTRISDLITAIGTDYKFFRTMITGSSGGDLTGLTTTDKTSVVAAVNEVNAAAAAATIPDASTTVKGKIEIATLAEVTTGTDTVRAVTPEGVRQERTAAIAAATSPAASETVSGISELATLVEVATGTDALRVVTVAGVRQERTALKAEILGAGVPGALDTLDELAAALGDDANYAATITTALSNKQPLDTDLTAIAALTSALDKVPYSTGAGTWALTDLTSAARGLIDDTSVANMRTTLAVYSTTELGDPDTDLAALYVTAKV